MGDAQSAQSKKDAAAEEDGGRVEDAPAEHNVEDKPLKNNGQISEINGKADGTIAEVNGHCEDDIAAQAVLSPDDDAAETAKPLEEEETPLENINVEINEKELPNEVNVNEELPLEMTEMDEKQNDINESFRKFFSNIGLKLTVKKGSTDKHEIETETDKEESNRPVDIEDTAKETQSENAEQNIDLNAAQETYDNDSTTCPTLTDVPSEDVLENVEEKTTEAKEEVESDNVDADEKEQQDATLEEDLHQASPSGPEEELVVSPIKRFFTTGIFSGLRKKKKTTDDETTEKELVNMGKKETAETTEETVEVQQDKEEISPSVEAASENKLKEEIVSAASDQTTDDGKSSPTDPATITVNEPEIMSSQEKVQASPLKRLLSGPSLKRLSKKQRGRKSSDAKLSDSGEHISDQLMSSTESAENQKEEGPAQHSAEAAGEEDGAWASFKKLVTPKKLMKRSSLTNEETQIPGSAEETKPSEGEQISDHSTEDGKKRKDSSVSWEAVLCGSGRRRSRSRKTSDSEDEMPQAENEHKKHESPLESSNEVDEISAQKQAGSPSEGDGGSTWKSLKKLVTPKRKAKDEEESKDNIQSDGEVTQDDASFSIKKLIPGRKKRKSVDKQDQVSSDEADKEAASGEEDSETPAVVPLSEFDTTETGIHTETQADVESHVLKEADNELQQDLPDQTAEPVLPCDSQQTEAKKVQDFEDTLEKEAPTAPASNEEPEELSELISKHQQLSDIPEEGVITETFTEEAARDDTIAEDLIEITSEAITAPEPVDSTLADETEMISAVSQLSESSKTSGNTTPVPVEYDVKQTDTLLHQVIETISICPKSVPVCSDEVNSEIIIGSVSHQILETFVKEEPLTILEIHRGSDATSIKTGLNVEELDVVNELAATAQTESITEVNEAVSTEIVSEVSTEEFDTADLAVDEVHEVNVSHPEESIREMENTDESRPLVESQSEVTLETLPEGEKIVADESSLVEAHQDEKEPQDIDSQEAESPATEEESKDGVVEQEGKTLTQKEDETSYNTTDHVQAEDEDQPPAEVEELRVLAAVQAATLQSEEGGVQMFEKEETSEDIPASETATEKQREETEPLTEDDAERETKLQADAAKTEHAGEPEVLEAMQTATLDSEEARAQLLEKEVISEATPEEETVTDEPKEESEPLVEVSEPKDSLETEPIQELEAQPARLDSEEGSVQSLEKEVLSEEIPPAETAIDGLAQTTASSVEPEEELPVEYVKTEHVEETEIDASMPAQEVAENVQNGRTQEVEKEMLSEDVPRPDATNVIDSVTDEAEHDVVAELNEVLRMNDNQKTESAPQDVQVGQEDHISEAVDELQTLTAVHVSSVSEEASCVQVREGNVVSEVIPAPCADSAAVTDEPEYEVHLSVVQANVEGEKENELPRAELKSGVMEHAIVGQVITCYLKDVAASIPDVLIGKTSDVSEPLINSLAGEQELKETIETPTPLVQDDIAQTAEEGSVVMMMNVPLVQFEDNHRIQVQVVNVDIKSAETIVDTVLEVGVTETKEVIDVCHETVKEVDKLSAMSETEEELTEENRVTIQEVVQHVKENLPEAVPESVLVNLEQEAIKQPDAVTEASEIAESKISEAEDHKVMEDSTETTRERPNETHAVVRDDSATEQQALEDIPGSVSFSAHDLKEDLEKPIAELEKPEAEVTTEELKLSSKELVVRKFNEEAQHPQVAQSQLVTPSNTGLVVPQNTGIISSVGNVESPSSLSLEFKLNIQFGQAKAPASPPPPPERIEPVKHTDVSEVGVQVVEPEKQITPTPRAESQNQAEQTEVAVQATEIVEPEPAILESKETAVIMNQPVLLDVGVKAVETAEPVQLIKSTRRVAPNVQVIETVHTVQKKEKREVFLTQPVLSEAGDPETKAEKPVKQTEEEIDQEVWMDAEEDICTQEEKEMSFPEVEEPKEHQTEGDMEEEALVEHVVEYEVETAPESKIEEEESQEETFKTGGTCEIESEGEDFAVALEHPETATATERVTAMEWD